MVNGALRHKDSMNNNEIINRGDIQFTTAGTGIRHSEFNASDKDVVHFLQVCDDACLDWIGLDWFGLVWFGLVWFGLGWFGLVVFVLFCFCFCFCFVLFCFMTYETPLNSLTDLGQA